MTDHLLQRALYGTLEATGITAFRRWLARDCLTVLCAHGIARDEGGKGPKPTRRQMATSELDRQLGFLKEKYDFISIDGIERALESGSRGGKPKALFTIDDGYRRAWLDAWPILERHGIPVVVFVATGHMASGKPFWWDRLDYVFLHLPADLKEIVLGAHRLKIDLSSREARTKSARHITRQSRTLFNHEKDRFRALEELIGKYEQAAWLEDLKSWVGVMSSQDVAAASNAGMEIGSHTVHHYRMGDLDRDAVRGELRDSKTAIEKVIGKPCRVFCFPEGSMNATSREEVEFAGYQFAFCSETGLNSSDADRFALRRMHLPLEGSRAYVLARVAGVVDAVSKARARLGLGRN